MVGDHLSPVQDHVSDLYQRRVPSLASASWLRILLHDGGESGWQSFYNDFHSKTISNADREDVEGDTPQKDAQEAEQNV